MPTMTFTVPKLRSTLAALSLAGVAALAGCSGDAGAPAASPTAHHQHPSASATASTHNDQDVMFAQMMIPHHQQAVEMSDLLLESENADQDIDPQLLDLAQQIKAAQAPEITQLQDWLTDWGANQTADDHQHGGEMDDGMLSPAEMTALERASGTRAGRLFLSGMIAHHRGAITMSEAEVADGQNADAVELAESIISSQQAEIDTMTTMLEELD